MTNSDKAAAAQSRPAFRLTTVWPEITTQDAEDLLAFWKREGAIPDESQARARLKQVVMLARDADGEIAGVCTSLPMTPPQLGQPVFFWRAFVGKQWRHTRLIFNLLTRSFSALEDYACGNDYPCIGVLLELENSRFREVFQRAEWRKTHFVYIGKSPRGLDVRVRYFRGAKLK
ncbi:MAG: hypothetical protein WBW92_01285 [Rhodanobacteraceae bacterium]